LETFLSQTSFIPVTAALTRYLYENGISAFISNYPYWYNGTTPFKFFIGPIVPVVEVLIKYLLGDVSFINITICLIVLSFLLSVIGWYYLVVSLNPNIKKVTKVLFIIIAILLPWRMFYALTYGEATLVIARNLIPFVFWVFYLKKKYLSFTLLSMLLLINTSVLPFVLIGLLAVSAAEKFKYLKSYLSLVLYSLAFVTIWYTPGYWIAILTNPSVGGTSGLKAILRLLSYVREGLPVALAIVAVLWQKKILTNLEKFTYTWVFSFLFLTLFRFVGDMDFFMDWSIYFYELEIALLLLFLVNKKFLSLFVLPIYTVYRLSFLYSNDYNLKDTLSSVYQVVGDRKVFLSGSSVFWANSYFDIKQLRGGRDQVALDPIWDKAAYEFREGSGLTETKIWLDKTGIEYMLVHTNTSWEYYHDFRNSFKWSKLGDKVWEKNGDILYKIK